MWSTWRLSLTWRLFVPMVWATVILSPMANFGLTNRSQTWPLGADADAGALGIAKPAHARTSTATPAHAMT